MAENKLLKLGKEIKQITNNSTQTNNIKMINQATLTDSTTFTSFKNEIVEGEGIDFNYKNNTSPTNTKQLFQQENRSGDTSLQNTNYHWNYKNSPELNDSLKVPEESFRTQPIKEIHHKKQANNNSLMSTYSNFYSTEKKQDRPYEEVKSTKSRQNATNQRKMDPSSRMLSTSLAKRGLGNSPIAMHSGARRYNEIGYVTSSLGMHERPKTSTPYEIKKLIRIVNMRNK